MANGKLVYPSGEATQQTYTFVKNFDYGHELGYVETDDNARAFDGTLNSYAGPRKKTFSLEFSYTLKAQFDQFMTLWRYQCPMDLYLDGSTLDATVKIMTPPSGNSEKYFNGGAVTYSFTVEMEEV